MIRTLSDVGAENKVTNKMDGAVYSLLGDCIINGIGNEFNETHQDLTITISSGEALLNGHFFKITGNETITLNPNSTGFVCLSIDTTRPNGSRGYLSYKAEDDIKKEIINGSGTLRDLPIYKVVTNSNSITSISDNRVIKNSETIPSLDNRLDGKTFKKLTQAQYNSLSVKDENTFYFIVG